MAMGDKAADTVGKLKAHIVTNVSGVSDPLLTQTIHRAGSEWMRLARVWRETLSLGDLEDEVYTFNLEQDEAYRARVNPLMWVKIDGTAIERLYYTLNEPASAGEPQTLTLLAPYNTLADGDVTARVVWVPMFDASEEPDWVWANFGGYIADLAIGRLLRMPRKPWTDVAYGTELEGMALAHAMRTRSESERNDPQEVIP